MSFVGNNIFTDGFTEYFLPAPIYHHRVHISGNALTIYLAWYINCFICTYLYAILLYEQLCDLLQMCEEPRG